MNTKTVVLIIFMMLSGCRHITAHHNTQTIDIAQDVTLNLSSPEILGVSKVITQSVIIKHANQEHHILAKIEIEPKSLVFVGLTPLGVYLFSIKYQNNKWHYDIAQYLPDTLNPKYLLADFQLTYWPSQKLQLSGATIIENASHRSIVRQGKKIIDIQYDHTDLWKAKVHFKHLERNYSVLIETK